MHLTALTHLVFAFSPYRDRLTHTPILVIDFDFVSPFCQSAQNVNRIPSIGPGETNVISRLKNGDAPETFGAR